YRHDRLHDHDASSSPPGVGISWKDRNCAKRHHASQDGQAKRVYHTVPPRVLLILVQIRRVAKTAQNLQIPAPTFRRELTRGDFQSNYREGNFKIKGADEIPF